MMAITHWVPQIPVDKLFKGQRIKVYSDNPSMLHASVEIMRWGNENGLTRDGRLHEVGEEEAWWAWYYIRTDEEIQQREDDYAKSMKRLREMPITQDSSELLREHD